MSYWIGILLAIFSGISSNLGTLAQKKVVNDLPTVAKQTKFLRTLVKTPLWLFGLALQFVVGTILFMLAQVMIGPALIPGLMAAGLIILAIGSVKLIGESLKLPELLGLLMIGLAIITFTFSGLVIDIPGYDFLTLSFLIRIGLFTTALTGIVVIFQILQWKWVQLYAISQAVTSGLLFAISNYWISPLLATFVHVFAGTFILSELGLFSIASIILILTNIFGTTTIQNAFKTGQASLMIPIQQVPIQIIPGLVYLLVFLLPLTTIISPVLFVIGIILIIVGSYLLAKRQLVLEAIE
ncbi:MAG: hypothetical protein ACFE89_11415 [Candidatus Hodarchaeota archaeon]